MHGYIKTYRKLTLHWLWKNRPFSHGQAWLDLLMLAEYKPGKELFRGGFYELQPGQLVTSDQVLADRWGWTRKRARLFLKRLKNDEMLDYRRDNRKSIITICNWESYQANNNGEDTTEGTSEGQQREQLRGQQKIQQNPNNCNALSIVGVQQKDQQKGTQRVHNNKEYKKLRINLFNQFWDLYDKKRGKKKAVLLWDGLSYDDIDLIIKNVPLYKESTPDKQYRKDPVTYLRNEAWKDEIILKPNIQPKKEIYDKPLAR